MRGLVARASKGEKELRTVEFKVATPVTLWAKLWTIRAGKSPGVRLRLWMSAQCGAGASLEVPDDFQERSDAPSTRIAIQVTHHIGAMRGSRSKHRPEIAQAEPLRVIILRCRAR